MLMTLCVFAAVFTAGCGSSNQSDNSSDTAKVKTTDKKASVKLAYNGISGAVIPFAADDKGYMRILMLILWHLTALQMHLQHLMQEKLTLESASVR